MQSLTDLFTKFRLRVNDSKSAVDRAWNRSFLGFAFWAGPKRQVRLKVASGVLSVMKDPIRQITRRSGGRNLARVAQELGRYLLGWKGYFLLAETPWVMRELDEWIRHRLRAIQLKQWRRGRTVYREVRARGMSSAAAKRVAANTHRWWKNLGMTINIALPISYSDGLGVPRLAP